MLLLLIIFKCNFLIYLFLNLSTLFSLILSIFKFKTFSSLLLIILLSKFKLEVFDILIFKFKGSGLDLIFFLSKLYLIFLLILLFLILKLDCTLFDEGNTTCLFQSNFSFLYWAGDNKTPHWNLTILSESYKSYFFAILFLSFILFFLTRIRIINSLIF